MCPICGDFHGRCFERVLQQAEALRTENRLLREQLKEHEAALRLRMDAQYELLYGPPAGEELRARNWTRINDPRNKPSTGAK